MQLLELISLMRWRAHAADHYDKDAHQGAWKPRRLAHERSETVRVFGELKRVHEVNDGRHLCAKLVVVVEEPRS